MWCIVYGMKVLKRHTHTHTAMCIFGLFTIFAVFPAHIHKVQKCLSIFNKSLHVYDVNQERFGQRMPNSSLPKRHVMNLLQCMRDRLTIFLSISDFDDDIVFKQFNKRSIASIFIPYIWLHLNSLTSSTKLFYCGKLGIFQSSIRLSTHICQ